MDMEEWIKHSCIFNYLDDTETSCKDKDEQVVIKNWKRMLLQTFKNSWHQMDWLQTLQKLSL